MIVGETEQMLEDSFYEHDDLFGLGKGKRKGRTAEEKAQRKENRKKFWSKIGDGFTDSGGLDGITSSLENALGLFKKDTTAPEATDYSVGLGSVGGEDQPDPQVPTSMYVVGGLLAAAGIAWIISKASKAQKLKLTPQP